MVETKFNKLGVETKFNKLGVETRFATLDRYPTVPNPTTDDRRRVISISCVSLKYRLENGMIDEVKDLINEGIRHERLQFLGLEYQYISKYLLNEMSYDEMFLKLETSIHQYAKRQMTWFRKMEREGNQIHWLDATKPMEENLISIKLLLE